MIKTIFGIFIFLSLNFSNLSSQVITNLKPTIILISFDGFHPSYLERIENGHLAELGHDGVIATWMIPVYPTKTFPNHYSIVTGLYSEQNGIIHNTMFDPVFNSLFSLSKREEVQNSRWWQGEPIWITAEKNGIKTAPLFFPGSEAQIAGRRPTYWKPYDGSIPNSRRIKKILSLLDLSEDKRPQFITHYFSDLDDVGHDYGPQSLRVNFALNRIDSTIGQLIEGLKKRAIFNKVNLIFVSDHGMARVDPGQYIILDDYFDPSMAEVITWDQQLTGIFPKPGREEIIYKELHNNYPEHIKIYKKEETPSEWHYRENRRIPPIICQADEGWRIIKRDEYDKKKNEDNLPKTVAGSHGYDNRLESMQAMFLAYGPAFKKELLIEPFENIQLYSLMARILNITPAPNKGSMKWVDTVLN